MRSRAGTTGRAATITVFMAWTLIPIYWLISTSLKSPLETTATPPVWFPSLDISAYTSALHDPQVLHGILNSLIVAVGATVAAVLLGALAAFALAQLIERRAKNLEFWILSSRMAPPVAVAIPFFVIYNKTHLYDTVIGLILAHVLLVVGIVCWILIEAFRSISGEVLEAALVDGASYGRAFRSILLPLAAPGIVAAASVSFLLSWNDFFFALVLTNTNAATAPLAIYQAIGYQQVDLGQLAATSTIVLVPTALVVGLFQRQLVSGLSMGAVKG